MKTVTAEELKAAARRFGADLVGIAPVENLADLPPRQNPRSLFSRAKNVIVLGKMIPRGEFAGIEHGTEMDHSYGTYGFLGTEDNFLAKTTYDVVIWMEAHGYEAVPLFAYDTDGEPVGVPVAEGKEAPNIFLPYRLMAQAAGLGETGLNGLFLTEQFGPRQRFAMLLTDAELEADAPFVPHICDDCGACIRECPLRALDAENGRAEGVKDLTRPVAARNDDLCKRCRNGAIPTGYGRFNTVDRIAASCGRACIAALERGGKYGGKYAHKFRTSENPEWKINYLGEVEK